MIFLNHFTWTPNLQENSLLHIFRRTRNREDWIHDFIFLNIYLVCFCTGVQLTNVISVEFLVAGNVDEQHRKSHS